ncbi:MAG: hypothetical protein JNM46_06390 [Anaerolineales bacterium]|nr:hypothetical protein [Anaerolineales bacterium]
MTKKIASILVLCLQLACGVFSTPEPTPTPQPTFTSTPVPTNTAQPTSIPEIDFGDMTFFEVVENFTISIPYPYLYEVRGNIVVIANEERSLFISFAGDNGGSLSLDEIINDYLGSLEARGANFEKSQSEKIIVDGFEGIVVNIVGELGNGIPVEGKAIAVLNTSDSFVFGLATTDTTYGEDLWENKHQFVFDELIESIKFVNSNGSCIISTDSTYGYTEENPIKVGGGAFDGPSRERAYLDNLLGPNGENLSYERQGSTSTDTTILDIYIIIGSGINETLYLDEYNYSEPQAPVGFTCKAEFPLSAP